MTDDALARAEANFAAAKELCRTGHADHGCTYGGMSAQHGYWLATEDCPLGHGETCDLRAVCDGDPTVTGFIGSEPDPGIWYWVWRVTACQRCADLYADAHPEWKRPDPDAPEPSHDGIMARIRQEADDARARMNPIERAIHDEVDVRMESYLLFGTPEPPQVVGEPGELMRGAGIDVQAEADRIRARIEAARVGVLTVGLPRPEQTFGTPVAPSTFLPLTAPPPPPESGISPGTFGKLREAMNREGLEP